MSELDVLLRESLGRLAEPGDPTGVAEVIRARVEAAASSGDGGSGAGGSGGGAFWSGPAPFAILIGLSLAGGAALGLGGAFGRPDAPPPPPVGPAAGIVHGEVQALGCPGGLPVETLPRGTRVLAMERSNDGGYVSVRDPYALAQTVWLPTGVLVPDAGAGAYSDLPVSGCAVASPIPSPTPSPSASPSPAPAPVPAPAPAPKPTNKPKPPPPPPPPDTQAPTISVGSVSPTPLYGSAWSCGAHTATVTVTASDNVGVSAVSGSADFPAVAVTLQSHSGNSWVFAVSTPSGQPSAGPSVTVHLSFTAKDAAGNAAGSAGSFTYAYCLI
jgi:hypothetical protein